MFDDAALAQLLEACIEHAGAGRACCQQLAEGEATLLAQFPEHAQRPAAPEQIQERHDRPAGRRTAHAMARLGRAARTHSGATNFIADGDSLCYCFRSTARSSPEMTARIAPLAPPFPPEIDAALKRIMPEGTAPLVLFTTLARNARVFSRFMAGGLIDKGTISLRE